MTALFSLLKIDVRRETQRIKKIRVRVRLGGGLALRFLINHLIKYSFQQVSAVIRQMAVQELSGHTELLFSSSLLCCGP